MSALAEPIVVVGLGQLGTLFAEGFLKLGHPVFPALRATELEKLERTVAEPRLVLVTVGEDDLAPTLARLPAAYRRRVGLLQNELRPSQWLAHGVTEPTIAIVWFERKNGKPPLVVEPTRLFGSEADLLARALAPFDVRAEARAAHELGHELCLKNLFILALNLAGAREPLRAGELLGARRALFDDVVKDVLAVERAAFGASFHLDETRLVAELERAIRADPDHAAAGRSAPARLRRTLLLARDHHVDVPTLSRIAADLALTLEAHS